MKTIILCGGEGTRLHEETEFKPKALVQIGGYPILLHIMNIYAHYGYKEFILALGYKGDMIKDYFLNLSRYKDDIEYDMNTGKVRRLAKKQNYDYKIIFSETGIGTQQTGRVMECLKYVPKADSHYMVTYGDGVSSIDLNRLNSFHMDQEKRFNIFATMAAVHPTSRFGRIMYNDRELATNFQEKGEVFDDYINGGFTVFNRNVDKYLEREDMLFDTLDKLTKDEKLAIYRHAGYWNTINTMKDYLVLNEEWEKNRPWAVWEKNK